MISCVSRCPKRSAQAKRINEETERIVERAQEEAERILARAQEQAAFLIEERELTRAAEIKSAEIIAEGQHEADEIRRGADEYAAERAGQARRRVLIKRAAEHQARPGAARRALRRRPTNGNGVAPAPEVAEPVSVDVLSYNVAVAASRRTGHGATATRSKPSSLEIADDLALAEPIDGEVRLSRTGRSVLARAHLTPAVEGACCRCLTAVVAPIEVQIEEEALPSIDIDTGVPVDYERRAGRAALDDHHELDLAEPVREAISFGRTDCSAVPRRLSRAVPHVRR